MKGKHIALAASGLLALAASACSQPSAPPAAPADMGAMDEAASAEAAGPIRGAGVVTAVDAAAGTIGLDHQPIQAINWPAMTMQFRAENPAMLEGIAVGDQVTFELKSAAETQTISALQKQ